MGTGEVTQIGFAGLAVLVAVGQLALTMFSGSRVEQVRAQHMANLATAIGAADRDPQVPDAGVVADLRSDLRIATMQYRVARLTQTSLRLWVPYWLLLLGMVVGVYLTMTTGGGSTRVTSSPGSGAVSLAALIIAPLLLHLTAAYSTRRRQRPALDAVDPAYLAVDPPDSQDGGTGSSADGAVGLLGWLARDLWQEDRRARHDLRRRRLQPRLAFWSIRLTSVVTGLITGVALSFAIADVLNRIATPAAKRLLDGVVVEVTATSARDIAVLSFVAPTWVVLVCWVTWTMVERPWNIPVQKVKERGTGQSDGATSSPVLLVLGLVASLLGRSTKERDRPRSARAP